MLDFTCLAVVESVVNDIQYVRVYYQNQDRRIKESCFDTKNGWYARGQDVVVTAKLYSPIAVSSWDKGKQIRIYYLNDQNKICERVGTANSPGAPSAWENGCVFDVKVLPDSQLGVARFGRDDANISVFYQKEGGHLGEIKYQKRADEWNPSRTEFPKAYSGSSIYATSAKPAGEVRLYYQDIGRTIKEHYMKKGGVWEPGDDNIPNVVLAPKASISVLSRGYENKPSDLLIQVFSVRHDNKLIGMAYDQEDGGWEAKAKEYVNTLVPSSSGFSAVAACGNVKEGLISVFYQSEANIIAKYSLGEQKRSPLGIPTSLDIDTGNHTKTDDGNVKDDAKYSGNNNAIPAGDSNDRAIPTSAIESGFGLAYAIQEHTWTTNTDKVPPVTSLKTSPPIQQGYTSVIGFNEDSRWSSFIYGGLMIDTKQGKAVNHRGYLYAKVGGDYSFSVPQVQYDLTLLWVGETALKDYDTDNAFIVYKRPESGAWPSAITKTMHCYKGSYTPIRIITMCYSGTFYLDFTIKAPDGTMVLSGKKPQAYDWIKQHSPRGDLVNATPFPHFGKEI
ncbi:hypothetical protein Egran_05550 [Elaphomyces granulatus]|uniref:Fucose-specific lectin n=1 Tax=Elaphomyces granulatus TaxID=519963 RepID=A0A232LR95_9EURO|nr:hypothetical protein Egran_05550 [Elaphomyces granulatus]